MNRQKLFSDNVYHHSKFSEHRVMNVYSHFTVTIKLKKIRQLKWTPRKLSMLVSQPDKSLISTFLRLFSLSLRVSSYLLYFYSRVLFSKINFKKRVTKKCIMNYWAARRRDIEIKRKRTIIGAWKIFFAVIGFFALNILSTRRANKTK